MNGAQALVESLKQEQVERIFGYAGATICPVADALRSAPEIGYTLVRTEQNAGHMASGYALSLIHISTCGGGWQRAKSPTPSPRRWGWRRSMSCC